MRIRAKTLRRALERGSTYGVTCLGTERVEFAPGVHTPCVLFVVDNQVATYAVPCSVLDDDESGWVTAAAIVRHDRPTWGPAGTATM